jgi:predicted metal-dependent hydrolase
MVGTAYRNEQQFYKVVLADGSDVILALKDDTPAGWLIEEVKLKRNKVTDQKLLDDVCDYVSQFRVRNGPPVALLRQRTSRSIFKDL